MSGLAGSGIIRTAAGATNLREQEPGELRGGKVRDRVAGNRGNDRPEIRSVTAFSGA